MIINKSIFSIGTDTMDCKSWITSLPVLFIAPATFLSWSTRWWLGSPVVEAVIFPWNSPLRNSTAMVASTAIVHNCIHHLHGTEPSSKIFAFNLAFVQKPTCYAPNPKESFKLDDPWSSNQSQHIHHLVTRVLVLGPLRSMIQTMKKVTWYDVSDTYLSNTKQRKLNFRHA